MKTRFILCILIFLALISPVSAADVEGGVNIEPVIEDTIFESLNHTETTHDLEDWNITMTLNDAAFNNNTTFTLMTQICNNDGICFAPSVATLSTEDNKTFTSGVTTLEDHTYVNWRITATYADDDNTTEKFPSSGFYKTWSDCWYHEDEWGGDGCPVNDSNEDETSEPESDECAEWEYWNPEKVDSSKPGNGCPYYEEKEDSDDESFLPAIGVMMTVGAITLAAVRRSE